MPTTFSTTLVGYPNFDVGGFAGGYSGCIAFYTELCWHWNWSVV